MGGPDPESGSVIRPAARAVGLLCMAMAAAPAIASGDPIYVAPDDESAGFFCSQTQPCGIAIGINLVADDDDEVLLAPGFYEAGGELEVPSTATNVTIRPLDPAAPRPVVHSTASVGLQLTGSGATVRGIELRHENLAATGILAFGNAKLRNLVVTSDGDAPCQLSSGRLTDSICHATGVQGRAVRVSVSGGSANTIIRNSTLIADGDQGVGIYASASGGSSVDIDVASTIAVGDTFDVEANTTGGSTASIDLARSNYDSISALGVNASATPVGPPANQSVPPVFTGPTFEQAPSSPTVDQGLVDAETQTTDVYGDARPQGAGNDIGADEFAVAAPPADTTPPDTSITKKPKKKSSKRTARFAFASTEPGSTFECKVDKGGFKPCDQALKLKKLERRRHGLAVRAIDPAGNADQSPATYAWKVKKRH